MWDRGDVASGEISLTQPMASIIVSLSWRRLLKGITCHKIEILTNLLPNRVKDCLRFDRFQPTESLVHHNHNYIHLLRYGDHVHHWKVFHGRYLPEKDLEDKGEKKRRDPKKPSAHSKSLDSISGEEGR